MQKSSPWIKWFDQISIRDIPLVGGKNASLGEMYRQLSAHDIEVPYGFAITADAYYYFIEYNKITNELHDIFNNLEVRDISALERQGLKARQLFLQANFPQELTQAVLEAYRELKRNNKDCRVAVRSSATAEDLPEASFAGAQETFLNIEDE